MLQFLAPAASIDTSTSESSPMLAVLLLFGMIALGVVIFVQAKNYAVSESQTPYSESRPSRANDWDYTHSCRGTAIGLSRSRRQVLLKSVFPGGVVTRTYDFDQVREWRINSPLDNGSYGSDGSLNSSLLALGQFVHRRQKNEAATGLFLRIRDIEHPEWQIRFESGKARSHELIKWTEILTQEISESLIQT